MVAPISLPSGAEPLPDDLLEVGQVLGAWGVRGWIKLAPESGDAAALLRAKTWWLQRSGLPGMPRAHAVRLARRQGAAVVALLDGLSDRDQAEALRGQRVLVRRADFPPAEEGSFYWVDLIGCTVFDPQGNALGIVVGLIDNAAHATLRVQPTAADAAGTADGKAAERAERLIPFVDAIVPTVDLAHRRIVTTWDESFF